MNGTQKLTYVYARVCTVLRWPPMKTCEFDMGLRDPTKASSRTIAGTRTGFVASCETSGIWKHNWLELLHAGIESSDTFPRESI
jgi:hypothetical protein